MQLQWMCATMGRCFALLFVGLAAFGAAAEPSDQQAFGVAVSDAWTAWKKESNGIRRAELLTERGKALRQATNNKDVFTAWEFEVMSVDMNDDGYAYVVLAKPGKPARSDSTYFLSNMSVSSQDPVRLRFAPGSKLYDIARTLANQDRVLATGSFVRNDVTGYFEAGAASDLTMEQRFQGPFFIVRFTAIKKI